MRNILLLGGLGFVAWWLWRENRKMRGITRPGRPGAEMVRFAPGTRPGAEKIPKGMRTGKVRFTPAVRPGIRPRGMGITGLPTKGRMLKRPAPPIRVRPGLSECNGWDTCPPHLERQIRSLPVMEQNAAFYRNLIEPDYGFPV